MHSWTNVDFSSTAYCGIRLRSIARKVPMILISNMLSEITLWNNNTDRYRWANEFNLGVLWRCVSKKEAHVDIKAQQHEVGFWFTLWSSIRYKYVSTHSVVSKFQFHLNIWIQIYHSRSYSNGITTRELPLIFLHAVALHCVNAAITSSDQNSFSLITYFIRCSASIITFNVSFTDIW